MTDGAEQDAPEKRATSKLWTQNGSRLVLLLGGLAAWVIAVALAAVEKGIPVATVFVPAGLALIGGAAFFDRLRKLGPAGLEVAAVEAVRHFSQSLPPPPADASADIERELLLHGLEDYFSDVAHSEDQTIPAELAARRYETGMALELAVRRWLESDGARVFGGSDAGVDLIGHYDDRINVVEVRSSRHGGSGPTPEQLRERFLRARVWADREIGEEGSFYRLLATDVIPPPHLRDRFRDHGIGIVHVDPDTEDVSLILPPEDSRS